MNTICKLADIDIYLLYYLDIKTVLAVTEISKEQNTLMINLDFVKQLRTLVQKHGYKNIIVKAVKYNYISLIIWVSDSINKFKYSSDAINSAAENGHINILDWFANSRYKFKYSKYAIDNAAQNGARRRLRFHRDLIRRRRENA